jgi:hypothetical protein
MATDPLADLLTMIVKGVTSEVADGVKGLLHHPVGMCVGKSILRLINSLGILETGSKTGSAESGQPAVSSSTQEDVSLDTRKLRWGVLLIRKSRSEGHYDTLKEFLSKPQPIGGTDGLLEVGINMRFPIFPITVGVTHQRTEPILLRNTCSVKAELHCSKAQTSSLRSNLFN